MAFEERTSDIISPFKFFLFLKRILTEGLNEFPMRIIVCFS
ncbi:MAG: hypothetical protein K0S53_2231 [Bacteroidetes bacterium]|jgi:hypothetical protein|nr:hypothetical protein [Bacteroidota bacterium]